MSKAQGKFDFSVHRPFKTNVVTDWPNLLGCQAGF